MLSAATSRYLKRRKIGAGKVGTHQFESQFQLYEVALWLTE